MQQTKSSRWVVVGRIRRAHGVQGTLKIESRTEPAETLLQFCNHLSYLPAPALKRGEILVRDATRIAALRPICLKPLARSGEASTDPQGLFLAQAEQAPNREAAQALSGAWLLVERNRLSVPEGETLWADLIGLTAQDPTGKPLGEVIAVRDFGAGPLLEIIPPPTPTKEKTTKKPKKDTKEKSTATQTRDSFFLRYAKPEWIATNLTTGTITLNPPAPTA